MPRATTTTPSEEGSTVGIILAGGRSTRLGRSAADGGPAVGKPWLEVAGETFLARVVAAVAPEVDSTIVVAAPGQSLPAVPGARVVRDREAGAGPLAALGDGLRFVAESAAGGASPSLAIVASCDVPLLRRDVVALLVGRARGSRAAWTVPVVHGHPQVLLSAVRPSVRARIDAWLAAGRRDLRGLVRQVAAEDAATVDFVPEQAFSAVDPGLVSFSDIDTPADLARLRGRRGDGRPPGGPDA